MQVSEKIRLKKLDRKAKSDKFTKKKIERKKQSKNFLPTLFLTLLFCSGVSFMFFFVDPQNNGAVPIFFVLLFFALLFSLALLFGNTRRSLLISSSLTFFLILRYFGVGNILNFLLIFGVAITIDIYFARNGH
jgi:uncharacterized membrane protein SirB2